jgi:phosphopantetheine adenylyltransferase
MHNCRIKTGSSGGGQKNVNSADETVFFLTEPNLRCVSSTVVRDSLKHNASIVEFVPPIICDDVTKVSK